MHSIDAAEATTTQDTCSRIYALTDNGDWMEMLSSPDGDPFTGVGVSFLVVDVSDDDELYDCADAGEGTVLGRVAVVDGEVVFHRPNAKRDDE